MSRLILLTLFVAALAPLTSAQTRYVWNGGNGAWGEAARWTPEGVPAAADTAVIGPVGATFASTVLIGSDVTVAGLVIQSGGNGAGIAGEGDLTITDSFRWLSNTGPGGVPTVGGSGNVIIGPGATLDLLAPTTLSVGLDRTVILQGTGHWSSGQWNGQGRLVNEGTLILQSPMRFCFSSTPGQIVNAAGALIRYAASGEGDFYCSFRNAGTLRVESGLFHARGWGGVADTDTGQYEVWQGARLRMGGADRVVAAGGAVSGAGTLEITQGWAVTINGALTVPRLRLHEGGDFTLNSDTALDVIVMAHSWLGGTATVTVSDTLRFVPASGLRSTVTGPGELIVSPGTEFEMNGTVVLANGRTLTMQADWTWPGGRQFSNTSMNATLRNQATAVLAGEGPRTFFAGTFINEHTLRHEAGETVFNSGFSTSGEVEVLGGTLRQMGFNTTGGTDTGRYTVAGGARLEFTGGERTIATSGEIKGSGTLVLGNGFQPLRGTIRPGDDDSPGLLSVEGFFPQPHSEGVLKVLLAGDNPGTDYSQLDVSVQARLGGVLYVELADGFVPAEGDRFRVVKGAISPSADAFDDLILPQGLRGYVEVVEGGADFVVGAPVGTDPGTAESLVFAVAGPYPNPSVGAARLSITHPAVGPLRVELFDLLGRLVADQTDHSAQTGVHEVTLDARRLPSGTYVVRVSSGESVDVRRLVVTR